MSLDADHILDDLELRWNQSTEVDITEFLSRYGLDARALNLSGESRQLLMEVVQIDLERRWLTNGRLTLPTIAEYLHRFPSLDSDPHRHEIERFANRLLARTRRPDTETRGETFYESAPSASSVRTKQEFIDGEIFGPYRIIRKIGEGGMGTVYLAVHSHLGKTVALKLLSPRLMHDAVVISRFRREMRAAGQIDHPNVVRAMDAGEINQRHFLVTEFIDGDDLTSLVRQHGTFSVDESCRIIIQAASALSAAHRIGMTHRDVKPSNLMLTKSRDVKLLDLGLMRLTSEVSGETTDFTTAGTMFGTPDYMAPEQWEDARNVDQRTDLYALGCTLFFLLVGRAPYSTDQTRSVYSKMKAHCENEIPDLCQIRPDVDGLVGATFRKLVAKRPEDRIANADELISCLASRPGTSHEQEFLKGKKNGDAASTIAMSSQSFDLDPVTQIDVPSDVHPASMNLRGKRRLWTYLLGGAAFTLILGMVWILMKPPRQSLETAGPTTIPSVSSNPTSPQTPLIKDASTSQAPWQLEFDGFDDRIDIPPFEFDWSQPFTWEAVIQSLPDKPRITTDNPSFADPIFRHGTPETMSFRVLFDRAASHWLVVHRPTLKSPLTFYSAPCLVTGQRLHLAVAYSGQELKLYVNGESQLLSPVPDLKEESSAKNIDMESFGSAPVSIGEDLYLAKNTHRWFRGRIGYVSLSKGLKEPKTFSSLQQREVNPQAEFQYLFAHDEQQLIDSSAHERHGRIRGAVWVKKDDSVEGGQPVTPQPTPSLPDPDRIAAEWVISHGGEVGFVERAGYVKNLAELPSQSFQVRHVIIQNLPEFTEADAQKLVPLRELAQVGFTDTTLAPGVIKALSKCRHLEELGIGRGETKEAVLTEVLHLPQLRSLAFVQLTGVTDELVAGLGKLPQLNYLQLYSCSSVTEAGLIQMTVAHPPKLQTLALGVTQIGVAGMRAISGIPHLQRLDLQGQRLDDVALAELSHSPTLAVLTLNVESEITRNRIEELQKSLAGCQIWVKKAEQAPQLNGPAYRDAIQKLLARGCTILVTTNAATRQWSGGESPIPPGDVLYAEDLYSKDANDASASAMDEADFQLLAQLTDIQRVNVRVLPPSGLRELLPLKNLNYLMTGSSQLTDADIQLLPSFTKLSSLAAIIPSDVALETIAKLPHLSYLAPFGGSGITDKGLIHLQSVPALSRIDLVHTTISREAAQAFANARPDVIVNWKDGIRLDAEVK